MACVGPEKERAMIDFGRGAPPPEAFPTRQLQECVTAVLEREGELIYITDTDVLDKLKINLLQEMKMDLEFYTGMYAKEFKAHVDELLEPEVEREVDHLMSRLDRLRIRRSRPDRVRTRTRTKIRTRTSDQRIEAGIRHRSTASWPFLESRISSA